MRRVVVTGLGAVTAAGNDASANWQAVLSAKSAIRPLSDIFPGFDGDGSAAVASRFDAAEWLPNRVRSSADRFAQFAVKAAIEARQDAGLSDLSLRNAAVTMGCSVGGIDFLEHQYTDFFGSTAPRVHPMTIPKLMPSAASSQVSMLLGTRALSYTVSAACASSNHAIGQAFKLVQSGAFDLAVTGGAEAAITPGSIAAWRALRVLAADTCRPFCRTRSGMAVGEGAAIIILEPLEAAEKRKAKIYCEVLGYGSSSDAGRLTAPDVDGMAAAMRNALDDADCNATSIDYINAHGTGTLQNDAAEVEAVRSLFGPGGQPPPMSSAKSIFGHALGAASAIEAFVTCKAIAESILPPTANFREPDPECPIDAIANTARPGKISIALSNAFAFGGINTSLVFGKV